MGIVAGARAAFALSMVRFMVAVVAVGELQGRHGAGHQLHGHEPVGDEGDLVAVLVDAGELAGEGAVELVVGRQQGVQLDVDLARVRVSRSIDEAAGGELDRTVAVVGGDRAAGRAVDGRGLGRDEHDVRVMGRAVRRDRDDAEGGHVTGRADAVSRVSPTGTSVKHEVALLVGSGRARAPAVATAPNTGEPSGSVTMPEMVPTSVPPPGSVGLSSSSSPRPEPGPGPSRAGEHASETSGSCRRSSEVRSRIAPDTPEPPPWQSATMAGPSRSAHYTAEDPASGMIPFSSATGHQTGQHRQRDVHRHPPNRGGASAARRRRS